ncbi:MAG: rRNA (guanine966-N2)-methyltransferase [Sphingomonadales bacterium]|jgi:16S rRNA (guanine966-N2)-methyltransferase|nr:rRNA (guanine966-N2)-methyltransferase [Sphingomonadales bacterium]
MRIIAGVWRGRPLIAPPGRDTRPTSDRAREGLFSMLASRIGSFEGLRVADLFAGTGALGLEALSRGAAHCTFVEKDIAALDALRRNLDRLDAAARAEVRAQAAEHAATPRAPCNLVLMDPPYRSGLAGRALARIAAGDWLAPGAWVSIELSGEPLEVPEPLALETERRFGKAQLLLLRRRA